MNPSASLPNPADASRIESAMCPVCAASAATLAATVVSGGGVAALLIKLRNKVLAKASSMKKAA